MKFPTKLNIYKFRLNNKRYAIDINTGFSFEIDEIIDTILNLCNGINNKEDIISKMSKSWNKKRITCSLAKLEKLTKIGRLTNGDIPYWQREVNWQRLQKNFFKPRYKKQILLLNLKRGMKILEVGCGIGTLSFDIAKLVLPKGRIVGLDISEKLLKIAREEAKFKGITNFLPKKGYAEKMPFADNQFNGVVSRYLLQHSRSPLRILKEMKRVAKDGAFIAAIDIDDSIISYPPQPSALEKLFWAYAKTQKIQGGDRYIGRKLYWYFKKSGFKDIRVYPFFVNLRAGKIPANLLLEIASLFVYKIIIVKTKLVDELRLLTNSEFEEGLKVGLDWLKQEVFEMIFEYQVIGTVRK